jgi:hypothetical protein
MDRTGCAEKASLIYLPCIANASKPTAQKSAELTVNGWAKHE